MSEITYTHPPGHVRFRVIASGLDQFSVVSPFEIWGIRGGEVVQGLRSGLGQLTWISHGKQLVSGAANHVVHDPGVPGTPKRIRAGKDGTVVVGTNEGELLMYSRSPRMERLVFDMPEHPTNQDFMRGLTTEYNAVHWFKLDLQGSPSSVPVYGLTHRNNLMAVVGYGNDPAKGAKYLRVLADEGVYHDVALELANGTGFSDPVKDLIVADDDTAVLLDENGRAYRLLITRKRAELWPIGVNTDVYLVAGSSSASNTWYSSLGKWIERERGEGYTGRPIIEVMAAENGTISYKDLQGTQVIDMQCYSDNRMYLLTLSTTGENQLLESVHQY